MIVAAVQDVNVVRDFWDWFSVWAAAVGGFAAAGAIWYAARAQRDATRARREVAAERGRQFELEVLREILNEADGSSLTGWGTADRLTARLRLFQGRLDFLGLHELPFWRRLIEGNWYQTVMQEMGHPTSFSDHDGAVRQRINDRLLRELREAIIARVEAGNPAITSGRWRCVGRKPVGHID